MSGLAQGATTWTESPGESRSRNGGLFVKAGITGFTKTSRCDDERSFVLTRMEALLETGRGPLVDLIVVNHNYGPFLKDCLESVRRQTYGNWCCTIVDNASTDDSRKIIDSFVREDESRFRAILLDENTGQMGAFKVGVRETYAEFVCFVDSDDILLPHSVYTHLAAHFAGRPVAVTSARVIVIEGQGRIIAGDSDHAGFSRMKGYLHWRGRQPLITHEWYWSVTSGMMFRRSSLELSIPAETKPFMTCADYFVCHCANLIGGSLLINEALCLYRVHSRNCLANSSVFGAGTNLHDITRHYDHQTVTRPILAAHLLENREVLQKIVGQVQFLTCYLFTARKEDIRTLLDRRQELGYSLPLIVISLVVIRSVFFVRRAVSYFKKIGGFLWSFLRR